MLIGRAGLWAGVWVLGGLVSRWFVGRGGEGEDMEGRVLGDDLGVERGG
jgi:hypothetical protein